MDGEQEPQPPVQETFDRGLEGKVPEGIDHREKRGAEEEITPDEALSLLLDEGVLDAGEDIPGLNSIIADLDDADAMHAIFDYVAFALIEQGREPEEVFDILGMTE